MELSMFNIGQLLLVIFYTLCVIGFVSALVYGFVSFLIEKIKSYEFIR